MINNKENKNKKVKKTDVRVASKNNAAAMKTRKRQRNKKNGSSKENAKGTMVKSVIKPGPSVALGAISDVPITVNVCYKALTTFDLALTSFAYQRAVYEFNDIYGFHVAMQTDVKRVASSGVGFVNDRPRYLNTLMRLWGPKTVKYNGCTYRYSFNNLDQAPQSDPLVTVRNKFYALYKNADNDDGIKLAIQTAPSIISDAEALEQYNTVLSIITSQSATNNLQAQPVAESSNVFNNDPSIYASRSLYVGSTGSCPSGGYASAENESYGGCLPIMSVGAEYNANLDRAAHELTFASGDATSAFGYGLFPWFRMLHYSSKNAPIIKYVDFTELWTVWCNWFAGMIHKASLNSIIDANNYLADRIPLLYAKIAFRQTVLGYFAVSQACTQFQGYKSDNNTSWEGFLVGSNTAGRLTVPLVIPAVLQENLRLLEVKMFQKMSGDKPEKHSQLFIPCIGQRVGAAYDNPIVNVDGGDSVPLFADVPVGEVDVNLIDGVANNVVYDFNSTIINSTVARVNEIVTQLSAVAGPYGVPNGSCNGTVLGMTRYLQYGTSDLKAGTLEKVPTWARTNAHKTEMSEQARRKDVIDKAKLTKTKSAKIIQFQDGLEAFFTRSYSCYDRILNEDITIFNNLVIPSVISYIVNSPVPSNQTAMQTVFSESNSIVGTKELGFSSIGGQSILTMFKNVGFGLAPGIAASPNSEIARVVAYAQSRNKGGFLEGVLAGFSAFLGHV